MHCMSVYLTSAFPFFRQNMRPTRGNANYMNYHFTQNMVLLETISRIITFITTTFEDKENKTGGDNSRSCQATVMPNVFHFGVFWLPTVSAISYPGFLFPLFRRLEANASRKFWTVRTKISDFCLKCACLDFSAMLKFLLLPTIFIVWKSQSKS